MTIQTNALQLIETAVEGKPIYPGAGGWRVTHDGQSIMLPGVGGITYNLKVGDSAYGWAADHAEPCVSATASVDNRAQGVNLSFNYFACVGNEVRVISGDAKGAKGVVTGTHGGCEHVMIDFPEEALQVMTLNDQLQIRARGQGLVFTDYPDIKVWSLDPDLLKQLRIEEDPQAKVLRFPVTAKVPAELLGSGLGRTDGFKADIDIQTSDPDFLKEHQLDQLKLGDFVALMDYKSFYGWSFQKGAITIGVVTHTDSYTAGHGPGVTTLITACHGEVLPFIQPDANLGKYLKIGRYRS